MPAKDRYHENVKQALIQDGWTLIKEQVAVTTATRRMFIDIQATDPKGISTALVEVKGFASPVDALAEALGQILLYQFAIDTAGLAMPLFLAVPVSAYQGILTEPIGEYARQIGKMKLIIFDPDMRKIVEWIS